MEDVDVSMLQVQNTGAGMTTTTVTTGSDITSDAAIVPQAVLSNKSM
jgi:hypothetical protein